MLWIQTSLDRNHEDTEYPNGISVDVEDLVIDGQGHAIDARQRTRIFNITGSVVLKNLTLKNGFAKERGCAIHTSDDCNLNIFGCRFVSNTAGRGPMFSTGGAIYCSHDTIWISKTLISSPMSPCIAVQ